MHRVENVISHIGHRRYCHLEFSGDCAILILHYDIINPLTINMRAAIQYYFHQAESNNNIRCIIITGEAGGVFSCGIDINDFKSSAFETSYEGSTIPSLVSLTNIIENSKKIVIAAMHGLVYSGGMELMLAAHYRVASQFSIFSFPEVQLGIIPCGGGTQRLPRLIGLRAALEMITSGKKLNALEGFNIGLVDYIVQGNNNNSNNNNSNGRSSSDSNSDVVTEAIRLAAGWHKPRRISCENTKISNFLINRIIFRYTERKIRSNTPKDIKAPFRCLEAIRAATILPTFNDGLKEEMKLFKLSLESPEAQAMQYLLRSSSSILGIGVPTLLKTFNNEKLIHCLGVIGCGTVGIGVTLLALRKMIPVIVIEINKEECQRVLRLIKSELELDIKNERLSHENYKKCLEILKIVSYNDNLLNLLSNVDIIIECVKEDIEIKKQVFTRLSCVCPPHCIIATSASSLSIGELAKYTKRPEKVIGMHFIPPSDVTPFLEIIQTKSTDKATILQAIRIGKMFHKSMILTNDIDGSFSTKIISKGLFQALTMLEQGAFPIEIDRALRKFGFRLGLFAMEDIAGIDFMSNIRNSLIKQKKLFFPSTDVFTIPNVLIQEGRLGQKTGLGWYSYEKNNNKKGNILNSSNSSFWFPSWKREDDKISETWGVWRKGGSSLQMKPHPDRNVELLILNVCRQKGILRRDISETEIIERILFAMINEAVMILRDGAVISSSAIDIAMTFGYGFPAWKGGICYYSDKFGLTNIIHRMRIYNRAFGDALFPPPCEELVAMAATQQTFRSRWP